MKWFFVLLVYLAFGFTFNVVFNGPVMDPSDAWVWAMVIGWPIVIGLWVMKWMLVLCAVILVIVCIVIWHENRKHG